MDIQLIRIDDRLIHGQVVVGWVKALNIQTLVVVNDAIAKNAMQKTLMEMAVPSGLKVRFYAVGEAVAAAQDQVDRSRSLLLFSSPVDVKAFLEGGASLSSINVGGMHFCEGKKQVCKTVCVSDEDVKAFQALRDKGVELEVRAVPGDLREPLQKYVPELKN
jgi:mannose/fructose/sorbose-specific phosphotransferase system IIB component